MDLAGLTAGEYLVLVQYELLLFAALFFLVGALDELIVDAMWLWMKLTGRAATGSVAFGEGCRSLNGKAAVLIPAWEEAGILATTIEHMLAAWPQADLRVYVGCYSNDPATLDAAFAAAPGDARLRIVIHDRHGPTTKADCLNRLYAAMEEDEQRSGRPFRMVLLHDAEDMVDPAALALCDRTIGTAGFVQLPVLPEPQKRSRWIGSHYCEEFAEAHGKAMVVRDTFGIGLPSAGVGCALERSVLRRLAKARGTDGPFDPESLTEDYELGLNVARLGERMRFLRVRYPDGRLVATRACFPASIRAAVRQKTRWLNGIAFQGWERLGWDGSIGESWMRSRDRRGPLTALVLATAYLLVIVAFAGWFGSTLGLVPHFELTPLLKALLVANFASLSWRALNRFAFTAREYGMLEGMRAIARIPVTNIIAIMAGRRAFAAYLKSFRGHVAAWDKTEHDDHPARPEPLDATG